MGQTYDTLVTSRSHRGVNKSQPQTAREKNLFNFAKKNACFYGDYSSDRSVTRRAPTSAGAPELLSLVARFLPACDIHH